MHGKQQEHHLHAMFLYIDNSIVQLRLLRGLYNAAEDYYRCCKEKYQPTSQNLQHPQSFVAHQFGQACDLSRQL